VPDLLEALKEAPLDAETAALVSAERPTPNSLQEVGRVILNAPFQSGRENDGGLR
jgi:hypothetical protein